MANSNFKSYDPAAVTVIVAGNIIQGYSDGSFVKLERNEDMWTLKVGCDGYATRVKTNNKSGKVTITLLQGSPSCDVLSALAAGDELSNTGAVPVLVKDNSGRSVGSAATAWVTKHPDAEFSKDIGERQFVMETNSLEMFAGGN